MVACVHSLHDTHMQLPTSQILNSVIIQKIVANTDKKVSNAHVCYMYVDVILYRMKHKNTEIALKNTKFSS